MGNTILVFAELEGGRPRKTAYELLGKAKSLGLGPVAAVVVGEGDVSSLGAWGAETVYHYSGAPLKSGSTGALTRALQTAVAASGASTLLAAASSTARDVLPRLAARLGAGLAVECTDLQNSGGTLVGRRPVYAGKALVSVKVSSPVGIFTVRPNSFPLGAAGAGTANVVTGDGGVTDADVDVVVVETLAPANKEVDLTEADRIVSGGRSLKSKESFDAVIRPLAGSVHATVGASRAAVDSGYAGHGEQVGQTGKVVNPSLYVAMGISGAIQHLAGMRTSRVIVAVNKDPEAPIFQYTTYGIVGDLYEYAPLLQKEFAKALG
jgi:electron transfer flavoprotein alpha subunit